MTHTLHTNIVHKTVSLADEGNSEYCQSSGAHNIKHNLYKLTKRSPQHWCPSERSNSELFSHENDALTALSQLLITIQHCYITCRRTYNHILSFKNNVLSVFYADWTVYNNFLNFRGAVWCPIFNQFLEALIGWHQKLSNQQRQALDTADVLIYGECTADVLIYGEWNTTCNKTDAIYSSSLHGRSSL